MDQLYHPAVHTSSTCAGRRNLKKDGPGEELLPDRVGLTAGGSARDRTLHMLACSLALADSEDAGFSSYDCPGRQFIGVSLEDADAHRTLLSRSKVNQPQDSVMRRHSDYGKLPKILIERYQYALLLIGVRKDGLVTRVLRPVTRPLHVITRGFQFSFCLRRDAGVQEKLQVPASIVRGSMRSLAAILRA